MFRMPTILAALMAATLFLTVAGPALAGDTKGEMISVDPAKLRFEMKVSGGEKRSYLLGEDATTYINKKEAAFKELRAGDKITVTDRKGGDAWYAIVIHCDRAVAAVAAQADTKGEVISVDPAKLRFEMKVSGGEKRSYLLGEDATTYINKKEAAFKELRAGDKITVTDRKGGDAWYAIVIYCERAVAAPAGDTKGKVGDTKGTVRDTKGEVISVDPVKLRFEMKLTGGEKRSYVLGEDATTFINNSVATFKELRAGDQVSVTDRQEANVWYAIIINCERKK